MLCVVAMKRGVERGEQCDKMMMAKEIRTMMMTAFDLLLLLRFKYVCVDVETALRF